MWNLRYRLDFTSSKAIDSVWHSWLAMDPDSLDRFCVLFFAQSIVHTPTKNVKEPLPICLRNAWIASSLRERLNIKHNKDIPLLFRVDSVLRMPFGFYYYFNKANGKLYHDLGSGKHGQRAKQTNVNEHPEISHASTLVSAYAFASFLEDEEGKTNEASDPHSVAPSAESVHAESVHAESVAYEYTGAACATCS